MPREWPRAQFKQLVGERDRFRKAYYETSKGVEQILGKALGYPKFADDQKNFPGATGDDVYVGEHVLESLAIEAVNKIKALTEERDAARKQLEEVDGALFEAYRLEGCLCTKNRTCTAHQFLRDRALAMWENQ